MELTKQQQRTKLVLERMIQQVIEDEDYCEMYSDMLETGLWGLQCEDAFGTEGQCDPRGDFRDERFTINYVQGIDV